MNISLFLIALAIVFNGTLAGASIDTALVKLPARKRIGARAYAVFARGNDLGNGLWAYPLWAIPAALLVFAAAIAALARGGAPLPSVFLLIASATSIFHFIATSQAAPTMLGIRHAPDDEKTLAARLDRFARWHAVRAVFQLLTFLVLVLALLAGCARQLPE